MREWRNERVDYGSVNLFKDFLARRYGVDFLKKLFIIQATGEELFNKTLLFSGSSLDLSRIFIEFINELYISGVFG